MASRAQYKEALEIVFSSATTGAILDELVKFWQRVYNEEKRERGGERILQYCALELRKAKALKKYYKAHVGYNTWED